MKQSASVQLAEAWSRKLGDALAFITGSRPVIRKLSGGEPESPGPVLWWHRHGTPATYICVSEADAETLRRMRPQLQSEAQNCATDTLAEILDRSWGQGEITAKGPSEPATGEFYQAEFPAGGKVCFRFIQTGLPSQGESNLDMLMDIELPITIRFGSTQMVLRDIAGLNTGSVIEFDQGVDEPVEVMVNGHVIARGEAVMVQGSYGVRISEISSKRDRFLTSSFAIGQDRLEQTGEQIG